MGDLGVDLPSEEDNHYDVAAEPETRIKILKRKREDSEGRVRSSSRMPRDESGIRDLTVYTL